MSNFVLEIFKSVRQLAAAAAAEAPNGVIADDDAAAPPGTVSAGTLLPRDSPAGPESHGPLVAGFLDWGVRYLLDNLARALDNDAFAPLVEQLQVRD